MFLATASAILVLAFIAAAIFGLKSYRPTRVPVVERARVPHGLRVKVNAVTRLRVRLGQQRQVRRSRPRTTAPDVTPVSALTTLPVHPVPPDTPPLATPPPAFVQHSLAHNGNGAPLPGSYFRIIETPSREAFMSDVRAPWAAEIVTHDGRITLPDSGAEVALARSGTE